MSLFTPLPTAYVKAIIAAAVMAGSAASGALVEHWRLGKKLEALKADTATKTAARATALTDRQAQAMTDAMEAVLKVHSDLQRARAYNARLVAEAAAKAPTSSQYACRALPLPDDYLETFRQ